MIHDQVLWIGAALGVGGGVAWGVTRWVWKRRASDEATKFQAQIHELEMREPAWEEFRTYVGRAIPVLAAQVEW